MDAQQPPAESSCCCGGRWKRRLLWLVLLAAVAGGAALWYTNIGKYRFLRQSDVYRMALDAVQKDPQVIARLGEPIRDVSWVPTGTMFIEGDRGSASLMFNVAGPKGEAEVQVQARRIAGQWGGRITVGGAGDRIAVDLGSEDEAPKFGAGAEAPKFDPGGAVPNPAGGGEAPKFTPEPPKTGGAGPDLRIEIPSP